MHANRRPDVNPAHEPGSREFTPPPDERSHLPFHCLSLDLEVGVRDRRIHAFAGVRPDTGQSLIFSAAGRRLGRSIGQARRPFRWRGLPAGPQPDRFRCAPTASGESRFAGYCGLPAVDTLRLNPLAFPRNPYHHLVKHYQDGQLKRGRINDPRTGCQAYARRSSATSKRPSCPMHVV